MAMRTIMYAFGAHEQDENGNLALNSKQTLEAIKFVRALFQEAMTAEVFTWDASSNNRAMIAGKVSVVLNAISITRTAEEDDLAKLISNDPKAHPLDKYKVLEDVLGWATNVGYPGYANAAIDEIFGTWVLNVMFAKAASGAATPEEALQEADTACRRIFGKWK